MPDVDGSKDKSVAGTPSYDYEYWRDELTASEKRLRKWTKQGREIVNRFVAKTGVEERTTFLNLFNANVTTVQSMMFGRVPQVDVARRWADAEDDAARVASEMLRRILNTDVSDSQDHYTTALKGCLQDRLLPGLGTARVRYDYLEKTVPVPAVIDPMTGVELAPATERTELEDEWVPIDYVFWEDFCWGYARSWKDIPWMAFRSYLSKEEVTKRFDAKTANKLTYEERRDQSDNYAKEEHNDPTDKAAIWEIWCVNSQKVYWVSKGYDGIMDEEDDPLGLEGFFPAPMPMMANLTTTNTIPVADFVIAQDLYNEIDNLQTRITILTRAIKAVGVYDKSQEGVKRVMEEGLDNDLIPVDNWAAFAEKGGLKGVIDWVPIQEISETLLRLRDMRDDTIALLYQITGLSDILRGASTEGRISATEQSLKAKFASVRIQALQDEFARFATDLQKLKSEVIALHYDIRSIVVQSNIMVTPDAQYVEQAIALIKQPEMAQWKIEVRPESVAMVDYAQLKVERTEYLTALATFLQSSAPLVEMGGPAVAPVLLELLKWGLAGFKGAQQIEGVVDRAIDGIKKQMEQPQQEEPSPEQLKMQAEQQKHQNKMQELQAKSAAEMEKFMATLKADMQKMMVDSANNLRETLAQSQAKMAEEAVQAHFNILETAAKSAAAIKVDRAKGNGGEG